MGRYLGDRREAGALSRGMLGEISQWVVAYAQTRNRADLAAAFVVRKTRTSGDSVARGIATLRDLPAPAPLITDAIDQWLSPRIVGALLAHGIRTPADLTVRILRRRPWWSSISGLVAADARRIEAFFAPHPALT
ncbi:hypothetical protein FHX57_007577 [Paraburkholderia tropica]|uniref:Integrase protein n=1 Tax=Paraburkholderia tropica TaxID=92647 RepID=A0ABX5MEM5_9BURK|nr:hypothetical protein [Paraburkholderia tropica]MBB3005189.1 hypothetical protein [Paraburkholderia tropica]MBB6324141.1 hypothetical protein [Paraburkholderia tropica]PXX07877.1 putative integrase protein [Paraburkholderia tropica]PZW73297.1 putative integrase protein [Paraburkholderia tropica]